MIECTAAFPLNRRAVHGRITAISFDKIPVFNANSVLLKKTQYANYTHFSNVKYVCLQYKVVLKAQFET